MDNKDVLYIYNDYGFGIYLPQLRIGEPDVVLPARNGNDIEEVEVTWEQIKFWAVTRRMPQFKQRKIRFSENNEKTEEEYLNLLRVTNLEKTRNEIWKEILDESETFADFVVDCEDIELLKRYYGEMVYLTNTNSYPIPEKNKLYLKARIEELNSGLKRSELKPSPMEDVLNIFDNAEIAPVVEEKVEEVKKPTPKKTTTKKTTTTRAKKTTAKK